MCRHVAAVRHLCVTHFGVCIRQVGRYAGFIAAVYSIAQFLSAPLWGIVGDRIGRKPTLLIVCGAGVIHAFLRFAFPPLLPPPLTWLPPVMRHSCANRPHIC